MLTAEILVGLINREAVIPREIEGNVRGEQGLFEIRK